MRKPKQSNKLRLQREATNKARARVLKVAKSYGYITTRQARDVGGWEQAWYHLNAMTRAGLLKKASFNQWKPTSRA